MGSTTVLGMLRKGPRLTLVIWYSRNLPEASGLEKLTKYALAYDIIKVLPLFVCCVHCVTCFQLSKEEKAPYLG